MLEGQFYSVSWIESDLLEKLNCLKLASKMALRRNFLGIVIWGIRIPWVVFVLCDFSHVHDLS